MIPLPLCCPLPCVRIPFLLTTDHVCGISRLVNTESTESLYFNHTSPQKYAPLLICPFQLSTPLHPFMSRLNLVFTLSYIFLIPLMVMSPFIPLLHAIHPPTPSSPLCDPPLVRLDFVYHLPPSLPQPSISIFPMSSCFCFHAW